MRKWLLGALAAVFAAAWVPLEAEAKRLGGGKSVGMQRSAPAAPPKDANAAPAQPAATPGTAAAGPAAAAAPAAAGATAAAAAGKRSWLGPIAGLAAGLGLAALFSSLGLGEELASFVLIALLAIAAIVAVRLLMRRFAGSQAAPQGMRYAAAGAGSGPAWSPAAAAEGAWTAQRGGASALAPAPEIGSGLAPAPVIGSALPPAAARALPADFDAEGFERIAKTIFVRLQDANDRADLDDLRSFTTPELFAELRVDLHDRGAAAQHTDVVKVEARVLDLAEEDGRQIVSVGFTGLVREAEGAEPQAFDEVWHLVRPADGSRNWAIAGIQQRQ